MNKDAESWAKVSAQAVCSGSTTQAVNVLQMALDDIQSLAAENATLRDILRRSHNPAPRTAPRKRYSGDRD